MSTVSKADSPGGGWSPRLAPAAAARVGALLAEPDAPPVAPGGARTLGILAVLLVAGLHAAGLAGSLRASAGVAQALSGSAREESSMGQSRKFGAMAGAVALSLASVAAAQEAVQWRVEDGGNGHWYQVRIHAGSLTWLTARSAAEALGGHLATVTSQAEDQFVRSVARVPAAYNSFAGPWIGGFQDSDARDYAEPDGGWRWVTGEPWFDGWTGVEPNGDEIEDYLHIAGSAPGFNDMNWNDLGFDSPFQPIAFLIEWSADCNNDGIVDFGQIRDGSLDDANGNNIPDCCESNLPCNCPGDIVRDGLVNGIDLAAVLNNWGATGGGAIDSDVNDDGIVNGADLSIVLGTWGPCE